MRNRTSTLTRTALLLAATIILQGLRLVMPIPQQVSMFVIGSLVNTCFVLAVLAVGWRAGLLIAIVTPFFAYLEGMLPFLPFVVPVAFANSVFVLACQLGKRWSLPGLYGAAVLKTVAMYSSFFFFFSIFAFPDSVRHMILFMMSWPQLVTGAIGVTLGYLVAGRVSRR